MFKRTVLLLSVSIGLVGCVGYPYNGETTYITPRYYDSSIDRYDYGYYQDDHRYSKFRRDHDNRRDRRDMRHDQGNKGKGRKNNAVPMPVIKDVTIRSQGGDRHTQRENIQMRVDSEGRRAGYQQQGGGRIERDVNWRMRGNQ